MASTWSIQLRDGGGDQLPLLAQISSGRRRHLGDEPMRGSLVE
jgi:hypothetical protein